MTSRTTLVIHGELPAKHQPSAKLVAARRRCVKVLQASELGVLVPKKSSKRKAPSTSQSAARRSKTIAQLDGKATQKKVRRTAESALGAPEGALDEKKAAVKEVCEDEMSKQASEAAPKKRKATGMSAVDALRAELKALKAENKKLKRETLV